MIDPAQDEMGQALARAGTYHMLAKAISHPGPSLLVSVLQNCKTLLAWPGDWPEGLRNAVQRILEAGRGSDIGNLAQEHVRLFGPGARCPLTETSWGDVGRMLGKAAQMADISGFYRAFKLRPLEGRESVPEDHLAMELEFMSLLCLKEAHARNEGTEAPLEVTRSAQGKFVQDHLGTWIEYWLEQLRQNAPPDFYLRVGEALRSLVSADALLLKVEPVTIRARHGDPEMGADSFHCPRASVS
ncbi:MAG: molecular chaperone TorD family protein [Gammaproteobacteria bacterium]|nr:molecular chaperone TorD family protein [Gammaproteobacteria bacterium]